MQLSLVRTGLLGLFRGENYRLLFNTATIYPPFYYVPFLTIHIS